VYGTFVRSVRTSRRLSQRQLAEISGVRQANISAIENGRRLPSADTLNRLLVACGYELSATAGERVIACGLPAAGWFPDQDQPPALPEDPPDMPTATTGAQRAAALAAVLDAVDAVTTRR
jgi:transcriptional regulator with XRE-family HTH domain